MSDRLLLGTRKGLLALARKNGGWAVARTDFPGIAATSVLCDPRDGALYAALKHGHFCAKLHRSDDQGHSWKDLPAPAFAADTPRARRRCCRPGRWRRAGNPPGRLRAGAIPAGLF